MHRSVEADLLPLNLGLNAGTSPAIIR